MTHDLILRSKLSLGDHVVLTAAVRDLIVAHPGRFRVDVDTPHPEVWAHNPHLTPLASGKVVDMSYTAAVNRSNTVPLHFLHGYRQHLEQVLGVSIPPGPFCGDIHLSWQERQWKSQVEEIEGAGTRFWIIVAGGKTDFTAKWWEQARWQAVVDHLKGRIRFVQVGAKEHHHPPLRDVLDLRGKTDVRQLIRLVYHADGVLCPVTSLMHRAAAVPWKHGNGLRPCVVVAGGREPWHWEAYPGHRFLHTIGELPCCARGGCWKSRVVPLGDGDEKDRSLCELPVSKGEGVVIPACLDRITAADVIRAVEGYLAPAPEKMTTPTPKPMPCPTGCAEPAKTATLEPTDPKVWGPRKWREFHSYLRNFKGHGEMFDKWLDRFAKTIPCDECRAHFMDAARRDISIPNEAAQDLELWGVMVHNEVNKRLGKPIVPFEDAPAVLLKLCGVSEAERKERTAKCKVCPHYKQAGATHGPRCLIDGSDLIAKIREGACPVWEGKPLEGEPVETTNLLPIATGSVNVPETSFGNTAPHYERAVGVVIGTYGAVPYIHLQLESLRLFHPGTPCLVVDDGSPQRKELEKLCDQYGAEFLWRKQRMGHVPGDMQAFLEGHAWAQRRGIALLVKFSRRWIPVKPWMDKLHARWKGTGAPTFCNRCTGNNFGFRSECVAMDVSAWEKSGALEEIHRDIAIARTRFVLAEATIHRAAGNAWVSNLKIANRLDAEEGHYGGAGGYVRWEEMKESRREKNENFLWHETHSEDEYRKLAEQWGVPFQSPAAKGGVLIRRDGAFGDALCVTPIIAHFRATLGPDAVIDVATATFSAFDGNSDVTGIYPPHHGAEGYERVIDLNNAYEMRPKMHIVDAYAEAAGIMLSPSTKALRFGFNDRDYRRGDTVILHCAKSWESRTILRDTWDEVASVLNGKGYKVVAVGTGRDYVPAGAADRRDLTLNGIRSAVKTSAGFIGSDSGLLHLAGTTDAPIVGIYTCASHEVRKPLRPSAPFAAVYPEIDCYGCLAQFTPPVNDLPECISGDLRCVREISAAVVIAAFESITTPRP